MQVVVVVPGIMGSQLRLGDELVWPGTIWNLIGPYNKMPELMRPDLKPAGMLLNFGIFKQYSSLLADLNTCGFSEQTTPPTLYPFSYDWRKSNSDAAAKLAACIEQAHDDHGGSLEIVIIAHSMGGLVSRYYLESGDFIGRKGFKCVSSLITIGTPHRGAALALTAAVGKEKRLFLSSSQVLQLASDQRYPSLYELLPRRSESFAWGAESDRYLPVDIYDPGIAGDLGLVPGNLDAASRFHSKIDLANRPPAVRYFAFYGSRQATLCKLDIRQTGAKLDPEGRPTDDGGDGTVPLWSGQLQGVQSLAVGGEHATLFRSDELRQTLAVLLGVPGTLAPPFQIQISVTPKVVEPGALIHVSVLFPDGIQHVDGALWLERINTDETGQVTTRARVGEPVQMSYSGGSIDKIGTAVAAPDLRGFYEIIFQEQTTGTNAVDDFIVQETQ